MKILCIKVSVMVSLLFLVICTAAISADLNNLTIEICHGGFIPLDRANGMVFAVAVISDAEMVIKDLTIDTKWWDSINRLHYKYVDNKSVVKDEIGCQDTPDVIYITGAVGIINGVKHDLTNHIRVVRPKKMGIDPGDYVVKDLVVKTE